MSIPIIFSIIFIAIIGYAIYDVFFVGAAKSIEAKVSQSFKLSDLKVGDYVLVDPDGYCKISYFNDVSPDDEYRRSEITAMTADFATTYFNAGNVVRIVTKDEWDKGSYNYRNSHSA